ncbi:hypothetical protein EC957_012288 [Mortierella hygrophila]|uniref:Galactose oxidase n=1 Tax=Mortierella hygrophila TaxID=979708 RepID=A0A9P6F7Q6_9FUNG|nr:hypothetical protein EC957_012288 [Mortierella hygrophila]
MTTHSQSHTNTRHRRPHLLTFLLFLSTTNRYNYYAHAQTNSSPAPVSGPAFARTPTHLYVLGGNPNDGNNGPPLSQFYSLDLTTPWNTTTPAWTKLAAGPAQAIFPATFSQDQTKMIVFHLTAAPNASRYDINTNAWTPSSADLPGSDFQGIGAVTDTNTGVVYMTAGYTTRLRDSLDVYNFAADSATKKYMPGPDIVLPARAYYGNVWSKYRNSILYFGGYNILSQAIVGGNIVTELVTATQTWNTLTTSGPAPPMRADHCMTTNEDGTMMVVFGGRPTDPGASGQNLPYLGDVYILNTISLTWTQGNPGEARIYAACTVSNSQLIVWGGIDSNNLVAPAEALVYNLTSASWILSFTPKTTASETATDDSHVNAGAIAGGVVAGVAVICACVLFYVFRRRRHARTLVRTTSDNEISNDNQPKPAASPKTREDDELQRLRVQLQNQQEQLDLQRRLLTLQQQQQHLQTPLQQSHVSIPSQQPQLYHDPSSGYQQPVYYSLAPMTSQAYSGQSDLNQSYTSSTIGSNPHALVDHLTPIPMPPVGLTSLSTPATVVTTKPTVKAVPASKPTLAPPGMRHDSNYWEERPPGNPHAIITP